MIYMTTELLFTVFEFEYLFIKMYLHVTFIQEALSRMSHQQIDRKIGAVEFQLGCVFYQRNKTKINIAIPMII